jgi:hypothetical protein
MPVILNTLNAGFFLTDKMPVILNMRNAGSFLTVKMQAAFLSDEMLVFLQTRCR